VRRQPPHPTPPDLTTFCRRDPQHEPNDQFETEWPRNRTRACILSKKIFSYRSHMRLNKPNARLPRGGRERLMSNYFWQSLAFRAFDLVHAFMPKQYITRMGRGRTRKSMLPGRGSPLHNYGPRAYGQRYSTGVADSGFRHWHQMLLSMLT